MPATANGRPAVTVWLAVLLAAVAMAVKDFFATLLMIAESEDRRWWAGVLDGASTVAGVALTVLGAGTVILHGLDGRSVAIVGGMLAADVLGTPLWTAVGAWLRPKRAADPNLADLVEWARGMGYVPVGGQQP